VSDASTKAKHHGRETADHLLALAQWLEYRLHVRGRTDTGGCRVRSAPTLPVSLNSRTVSMAITAWSAKVFRRSIALSANDPARGRVMPIVPITVSVAQHRHDQKAAPAHSRASSLTLWGRSAVAIGIDCKFSSSRHPGVNPR